MTLNPNKVIHGRSTVLPLKLMYPGTPPYFWTLLWGYYSTRASTVTRNASKLPFCLRSMPKSYLIVHGLTTGVCVQSRGFIGRISAEFTVT